MVINEDALNIKVDGMQPLITQKIDEKMEVEENSSTRVNIRKSIDDV
jgi:hypothetical protein